MFTSQAALTAISWRLTFPGRLRRRGDGPVLRGRLGADGTGVVDQHIRLLYTAHLASSPGAANRNLCDHVVPAGGLASSSAIPSARTLSRARDLLVQLNNRKSAR